MPEKIMNLEDLLIDQLKDLYSAETQLIQSLPKIAKSVNNPELKTSIEEHLEQTRQQKDRIDQMFRHLQGGTPGGKKCVGMEGILQEGNELLTENMAPEVHDAAIIAAAQKVEHYEISGYGTAATYADMLGHKEVAQLLKETLNEEEQTDKKLTKLAKTNINLQAKRK
jgi:ferritin-like metal-binding protein YciE